MKINKKYLNINFHQVNKINNKYCYYDFFQKRIEIKNKKKT